MNARTCLRFYSSFSRKTSATNVKVGFLTNKFNQSVLRQGSSEASKTGQNDEIKVYTGVLSGQIRLVKMFSISSSMFGLLAQPVLYTKILSSASLPIIIATYGFVGFFTICTPLLLHTITRKYVIELVYKCKTDTYVATFYNIFATPKDIEFNVDEVKVPEVPGVFTTFVVKGKPLFVDSKYFSEAKHYGRIMGYDKPLDLSLFDDTENQKKS